MVRSLRSLVVSCAFAFLVVSLFGPARLTAQPLARFVAPTNTTETSLQPTFRVVTKYKIDTSSLRWNHRSHHLDSTVTPTVVVIPRTWYDSISDTHWPWLSRAGVGSLVDDTTFEFTPKKLANGRTYEVIVMGLRVIESSDTITISDTLARMQFSTIDLPPSLVGFSFIDSNNILRTRDTITARFSSSLDSVNSSAGPILSLFTRHCTYDTAKDSMVMTDSAVVSTSWLDSNDNSILRLVASQPMELGSTYYIKSNLSSLTGDSTQDAAFGFNVKKSFRLNIVAKPISGLSFSPEVHFDPSINENYKVSVDSINDSSYVIDTTLVGRMLNANDTVTYIAPSRAGCARFQRWSCPGFPWDNSTDTMITVNLTADQLSDVDVIAEYGPVPLDTLRVSSTCASHSNCGNIIVISDSTDCGISLQDTCADSCGFHIEDGRSVKLYAYSTSLQFQSWSSNDPNIDGSTTPYMEITLNGSVNVVGHFGPRTPQSVVSICGLISLHNQHFCTDAIAGITNPDCASPTNGCISIPAATPVPIGMKIFDQRYGLIGYIDASGQMSFLDASHKPQDLYAGFNHDGTFSTTQSASTDCAVAFIIGRLETLSLTISLQMDDGELPPSGTLLTTTTDQNTTWCRIQCLNDLVPAWQGPNPVFPKAVQYVLKFAPGDQVKLTAGANNGITFNGWTIGSNPLTITMNANKTVTAVYHAQFSLKSITFRYYQKGIGYTFCTWPAQFWPPNLGEASRVASYSPPWPFTNWDFGSPVGMFLEFNRDIKDRSMPGITGTEEHLPGYGSMNLFEYTAHLTGVPSANTSYALGSHSKIWFALRNASDDRHYFVWKSQDFNVDLSGVQSASGEGISNPGPYHFATVGPDIRWKLVNLYIDDDHDPDGDEVFTVLAGAGVNQGLVAGGDCQVTGINYPLSYDDLDGGGNLSTCPPTPCDYHSEDRHIDCGDSIWVTMADFFKVTRTMVIGGAAAAFDYDENTPYTPCTSTPFNPYVLIYNDAKGQVNSALASYDKTNFPDLGKAIDQSDWRNNGHWSSWGLGFHIFWVNDVFELGWTNFPSAGRLQWWGKDYSYNKYLSIDASGGARYDMQIDMQ